MLDIDHKFPVDPYEGFFVEVVEVLLHGGAHQYLFLRSVHSYIYMFRFEVKDICKFYFMEVVGVFNEKGVFHKVVIAGCGFRFRLLLLVEIMQADFDGSV